METRANAFAVGLGVLLLLAGFIFFVLWAGRSEWTQATSYYTIYIDRSVTGLLKGSVVNYQGVPVGVVKSIRLDVPDVGRVRITVGLNKGVPIKQGVTASLEMQGLTGNLSVRLKGGSSAAALLKALPHQPYPVIPFEPSSFENFVTSAPEVMHKLSILLDDISSFFDAQNKKHFSQILAHTESISKSFDESMVPLKDLIADAQLTLKSLKKTSEEWGGVTHSFSDTAKEARDMILENRTALKEFTGSGLPELTSLLSESREMVQTINRTTEEFSKNPLRFFKGDQQEGRLLE